MSNKIFDVGLSKQNKQILLVSALALAAIAVYEFSENAGETAGQGIGTGAKIIGTGVAIAIIIAVL